MWPIESMSCQRCLIVLPLKEVQFYSWSTEDIPIAPSCTPRREHHPQSEVHPLSPSHVSPPPLLSLTFQFSWTAGELAPTPVWACLLRASFLPRAQPPVPPELRPLLPDFEAAWSSTEVLTHRLPSLWPSFLIYETEVILSLLRLNKIIYVKCSAQDRSPGSSHLPVSLKIVLGREASTTLLAEHEGSFAWVCLLLGCYSLSGPGPTSETKPVSSAHILLAKGARLSFPSWQPWPRSQHARSCCHTSKYHRSTEFSGAREIFCICATHNGNQ